MQLKPHVVPLHVELAFGGVTHAVHDEPQVATLALLAHVPAQLWKPALQLIPQLVPSHVAVPFGGVVHALHEAPHVATALLLTHAPAHRW